MSKTIKFKGNPVTLIGRNLKIGDDAPDFRVVSADLKEIMLFDFKSKIKLITTFRLKNLIKKPRLFLPNWQFWV
jgi:peroxiredoxin